MVGIFGGKEVNHQTWRAEQKFTQLCIFLLLLHTFAVTAPSD